VFCREGVEDLRRASQSEGFPPVLFFFQATAEKGAEFFGRHWPEARAVADPERHFYEAFGARRGSLGQVLGPRVWAAGLRAALKGHRIGKPVGDPWVMPALLLMRGDSIVWRHAFRHAGDRPESSLIAAAAESARREAKEHSNA